MALAYLADNVDAYSDITNSDGFGPYDGSVAKLAVAAIVAGQDPTAFGGYDLLHTLAADECAPTAKGCTPGSGANVFSSIQEAFVILAEARAGAGHAPTTQALDYFTSLQCASGGFTDKTAAAGRATPMSTRRRTRSWRCRPPAGTRPSSLALRPG